MKAARYKYGIDSEKLVKQYFKSNGYEFMAHRLKTPFGEIDLLFKKDKMLIFVEVKARNRIEHLELVSNKQISRSNAAASHYIANNLQFEQYDIRFDVVVVKGNDIYEHIENAW